MGTVTDIKQKSLTVAELIAELQRLDPNKQIMFSAVSGDYWQTRLAYRFIPNNIEEMSVHWDEYHDEFAINDPYDEDEDDDFDSTVYVFN